MTEPTPTPFSRRRFLLAGGAAAAGLVLVAGGVTARSRWATPSGFEAFFGDRSAAVAALGGQAIEAGAAPGEANALVPLLPAGTSVTGSGGVDITDPAVFADALATTTAAELGAGEVVFVGGFPLTPTEAAVCAACHIAAG